MRIQKVCAAVLGLVLVAGSVLTGCGSKKTAQIAPFSEATWETTESDLATLETREEGESYPSMYYGQTHTYAKNYLDHDGTVKYMFDDKGALMGLAWTAVAESEEQYQDIYNKLKDSLQKKYGDSTDRSGTSNAGDAWYTDEGDIILIGSSTDTLKVVQCGYLNPIVSGEDNTDYIRSSTASETSEAAESSAGSVVGSQTDETVSSGSEASSTATETSVTK